MARALNSNNSRQQWIRIGSWLQGIRLRSAGRAIRLAWRRERRNERRAFFCYKEERKFLADSQRRREEQNFMWL